MAHRPRLAVLSVALVFALTATACGADDETTDSVTPTSSTRPSTGGSTGASSGSSTTTNGSPTTTGDLPALRLTEVAALDAPTAMAARAGSDTLYVVERKGRVRALVPDGDGFSVEDDPVIDISDQVSTDGEQGLLGLTFSPKGDRLYLSYTNPEGDTRLVEYRMDGDAVDTGSRRELLAVDQPFSNHNGGNVTFGPDGFLYFGLGDGGSGDDPDNRAQDPDDLLGKLLRIDPLQPAGGRPYGIPEGNPYADGGGRPEIYLSGVRNPWRFSFDRASGDLWIGDVGQDAVEEIDHFAEGTGAGTNLGWSGYEGGERHIADRIPKEAVPPVFQVTHDDGYCSITGGFVYQGKRVPALRGTYLFGDYCKPGVLALRPAADGFRDQPLDIEVPSLVSFGEDAAGEVYLLSLDGPVMRIDPG